MDGSVSELGEFGSERYGAPLATSDIDKCFVLRPGQNRSNVFDRMIQLTAKDPEFTQKKTVKGRVRGDTFQFKYRGVFIDFKAMYTEVNRFGKLVFRMCAFDVPEPSLLCPRCCCCVQACVTPPTPHSPTQQDERDLAKGNLHVVFCSGCLGLLYD